MEDTGGALIGIVIVVVLIILFVVYIVLPIIGTVLVIGAALMILTGIAGAVEGIFAGARNFVKTLNEAHSLLKTRV